MARSVVHVLALCGSLRAASINAALLRAAARLAPAGMTITLQTGLGHLPLYSPDFERDVPAHGALFRAAVAQADALLIASPEYAHGVTGTIKNALDWLVSHEPFVQMPVALFNAAPRAHHANDALRETLVTMSAALVETASITVPLPGTTWHDDAIVADVALARRIREALRSLLTFVEQNRHPR
jgi:chromate reductase, NAD(P)H dehydrogenase (quinone)